MHYYALLCVIIQYPLLLLSIIIIIIIIVVVVVVVVVAVAVAVAVAVVIGFVVKVLFKSQKKGESRLQTERSLKQPG
ncbi:hypothetical protein PIROE2DRAFT_9463 [Piromyces sp. E2]|nr:hypothetical protein PIROE2DRAFT_9463 [Piromyces sp. E2]|eukprot:OUM63932.1 hypothetical protein PIROE2DRAFT_9463 [Piromyces sp. E2]